MELDLDAILKIMDRFDKSNMTGFSYEDGTVSLKLDSEKIPVVATAAAPAAVTIPANVENVAPAAEKKEDEGTVVKSPLVVELKDGGHEESLMMKLFNKSGYSEKMTDNWNY